MTSATTRIGLLLFPDLTQLDLTGPAEVFGQMPRSEIVLMWKTLDPVRSDTGLCLLPTTTFESCRDLDILCVPGGPGQIPLMDDDETLQFLRRMALRCRLITSVCTGSLILGAAGLLSGYRATCHWASLDQLGLLGAIPVSERVVRDRNRITGAGVTSGIDFALMVVADWAGAEVAERIQLQIEYDPAPPYETGSPHSAPPALVAAVRASLDPLIAHRRAATERAAARLTASKP